MDGNQVATSTMNGTALAPASSANDPFSAYGAKVGVQGTFLTFKNGEFLYGTDGKELPLGTRLAANVAGLRLGWKRWFGAQITDDFLELLVDQKPIAQRNTLGDMDPALWERDPVTKANPNPLARDPWQLTNELTLVDPDGETYIYATSSKGGIGAIGRLCKEYGKLYRQKPGMVPIVELANDYYMHKEYGKTYTPVFKLVDWVDESELAATAAAGEERGEERSDAPPPPPPPPPAPAAAPAAKRQARF